jgi:protein-tyrosine-phosphatase
MTIAASDNEIAPDRRNVLFVCTGNSARSIMAEAILNRIGPLRFRAFSAGSHPKGGVHPEALRLLDALGYDTSCLRSKSWHEFTNAIPFADVITVCSDAARESCPILPRRGTTMHWDIPNPTIVSGSEAQRAAAFRHVYDLLLERIRAFVRS